MTTPRLEDALPPPDPAAVLQPAEPSSTSRRPAPIWLWVLAVAAIAPAVAPLTFLFARVIGATDSAWATLFSTRTAALIARSIVFTAAVTVAAVIIGVAAAWLVTRTTLPHRRLWAILAGLPLVIPSYVIALTMLSFFGPRGIAAEFTGLPIPTVSGFFGAWLALTLSTYPYVFLVTVAALRRIDPSLEEAARGLGATPWTAFRTVVLPQLRPAVAGGGLLAALYTLSDFGAVSLAGFDVFTRVIYAQYQGRIDRTPAAVLSAVLIVIALVILYAEHRTRGRATYFTDRPPRVQRPVELSRSARRVSTAFLATIVTVGLAMPIGVLVGWLIRGWVTDQAINMRWDAVAGSLAGSLLAALLATLAAVPVTVLAVRHRSRASAWIERAVYAIFSIPHITLALAMVFFASRYLGGLYQSLTLLVVVYATIFLAQAVSSGRASLLQVNPHLEEASRGLGHGFLDTLTKVTVPLMWRGLAAGAALVFLTTMKELPATLLLRPIEFDTLAVRVWSAASEFFYARAAAPALILLAVSAVPMYLLVIRHDIET